MTAIHYRTAKVDGRNIFYRQAGAADAPKLLLLHGFPTAGHMFRDLIPLLADRFHIVAPDLPGFGNSDMPDKGNTFDRIAETIDRFTETIGFDRYAVYVFDYGAPTGFRLALKHPDRITAIISQNGNAYEEGLSDGWNPIQEGKIHNPAHIRPKQDHVFAGRLDNNLPGFAVADDFDGYINSNSFSVEPRPDQDAMTWLCRLQRLR